jgi:hypothetical protein
MKKLLTQKERTCIINKLRKTIKELEELAYIPFYAYLAEIDLLDNLVTKRPLTTRNIEQLFTSTAFYLEQKETKQLLNIYKKAHKHYITLRKADRNR